MRLYKLYLFSLFIIMVYILNCSLIKSIKELNDNSININSVSDSELEIQLPENNISILTDLKYISDNEDIKFAYIPEDIIYFLHLVKAIINDQDTPQEFKDIYSIIEHNYNVIEYQKIEAAIS